jgi:hypothetical protein
MHLQRKTGELYKFYRDDGTNTVHLRCKANSSVYITDKSRRLDIEVSVFENEVKQIEQFVSERLGGRPVLYGICSQTNVMRGVKIPCKYGHVTIPVIDHNNRRITTFDIVQEDTLELVMELKTVWCSASHCGLIWVLHSIKKTTV